MANQCTGLENLQAIIWSRILVPGFANVAARSFGGKLPSWTDPLRRQTRPKQSKLFLVRRSEHNSMVFKKRRSAYRDEGGEISITIVSLVQEIHDLNLPGFKTRARLLFAVFSARQNTPRFPINQISAVSDRP